MNSEAPSTTCACPTNPAALATYPVIRTILPAGLPAGLDRKPAIADRTLADQAAPGDRQLTGDEDQTRSLHGPPVSPGGRRGLW